MNDLKETISTLVAVTEKLKAASDAPEDHVCIERRRLSDELIGMLNRVRSITANYEGGHIGAVELAEQMKALCKDYEFTA